jgi:hypothetical protein
MVEAAQMRLEVDMDPFYPTRRGDGNRLAHQLPADAAPPILRMDGRIQQKGMNAAVPVQVV